MNYALNLGNLTETREQVYFAIALAVAILAWLFCIVTGFIVLVGFFALFAWLANGVLVAQLKSNAVKVDDKQLPELAGVFRAVCAKLRIVTPPDLYIFQSQGFLNAFATRHCGRNFVVVYSELLDTYGPASPEIEFLLGHELGHIKRSHILKKIFLAPGLLFPLLGNAYSRACEMSSDRHGAFSTSNMDGAINAMMVLAGGKKAVSLMTPAAFAQQYSGHRGFFVSWYELISGYPTLSQRVANLVALKEGRSLVRASRNPLAYVFALFTLGGEAQGGANVMITIAVIGLLAAIAIPSFVRARDQTQRARQARQQGNYEQLQTGVPYR